MHTEKIPVRITQTGQTMEVAVFDKRADHITVVLGEGMHSVKCVLTPTRTGLAYAGSVLGRRSSMSTAAPRCRPTSSATIPVCRQAGGADRHIRGFHRH